MALSLKEMFVDHKWTVSHETERDFYSSTLMFEKNIRRINEPFSNESFVYSCRNKKEEKTDRDEKKNHSRPCEA